MTYVWAGYVSVFGTLGFYGGRLVLRSRAVASKVLATPDSNSPDES